MATQINLSPKEEKTLQEYKKKTRDNKIFRRLLCIEMKNKGYLHDEIASFCGVCIDTLTDWLQIFERGSFEALCSLNYEGRRPSKLDQHTEEIKKYLLNEHPARLAEIQKYIEEHFGIQVEESWLWRWCKKNSLLPGNNCV